MQQKNKNIMFHAYLQCTNNTQTNYILWEFKQKDQQNHPRASSPHYTHHDHTQDHQPNHQISDILLLGS
jgi:hypothetical protein